MTEIKFSVPNVSFKVIVSTVLAILVGAVAYAFVCISSHNTGILSNRVALKEHAAYLRVIVQHPEIKATLQKMAADAKKGE